MGLARVETADDPLAGLWVGALAASEGLTISPVTAENLGARVSPLPDPWPEAGRDAFVTMLASGPNLLPVWEALDLAGCIACWLPEWTPVRARPQHNPLHRHTVDRHSVQTVVEAHRFLTRVERPDLLLLAALLHDIGKLPGAGAQHPAVGAPIARAAVDRIGLSSEDADLVALLVREHLTLAELATRRDHADPKTQDALVAAVDGRSEVLTLLRFLTEADARAAGPAAWSPWRASLISSLADQVEGMLVDGGPDDHAVDLSRLVDVGLARSVALDGRPRVRVEPRPGGAELLIARRTGSGCSATPPVSSRRPGSPSAPRCSTRSTASRSTPGGSTSSAWPTSPTPRSSPSSSNASPPATAAPSNPYAGASPAPGRSPRRCTSRRSAGRASPRACSKCARATAPACSGRSARR